MIAWALGVLLAGVVLIAAGELGARWWIRRRTGYYVWPPGLRLELHQHPEVFATVEPRVRFDINANGERGSEVRGTEAGLYRILVAGGSAAECLALDQATSWPGALERLLNTEHSLRSLDATRVHVGNIGRSSIASRHLDLIFERALPQYPRLAAIVIMVGASDMLQWLEDGAPPSPRRSSVAVGDVFPCHPEERFGWKPGQWAALEMARRLRRVWLRPVEVREQAGAWLPAARKMRARARELRTEVPDPAVMLGPFEHHFRRSLERAKAHADRVLVARQPWFDKECTAEETALFWHGGVGKAWKEEVTVFYALDVLSRLMTLLDARAAAVADEVGVEHLDLRPILPPSPETYYDFFHATPAGAEIVAQAIAAVLTRPRPAAQAEPFFSVTSATCISSMPPTR